MFDAMKNWGKQKNRYFKGFLLPCDLEDSGAL